MWSVQYLCNQLKDILKLYIARELQSYIAPVLTVNIQWNTGTISINRNMKVVKGYKETETACSVEMEYFVLSGADLS